MKLVALALIAACGGGAARWPGSDLEPSPPVDPAKVQASVAARSNESGIEAMRAGKYAQATVHFRDAAARSPEPPYLFNVCLSLYQEGKLGEARMGCRGATASHASPQLADKAREMIERIESEAKAKGIALFDGGGSIPDHPDPPSDQATIAAALSDEGVELMYAQKYDLASRKFREAVARVPEPTYFFNLCTSLFQEGKFSEALTSCSAGKRNNPPAALVTKLDKMIARIREEARAQNVPLEIH